MADIELGVASSLETGPVVDFDRLQNREGIVDSSGRPEHECLKALHDIGCETDSQGTPFVVPDDEEQLYIELTVWDKSDIPIWVPGEKLGPGEMERPPVRPPFEARIRQVLASVKMTLGKYGVHHGQTQFTTAARPDDTFAIWFKEEGYKFVLRGVTRDGAVRLGITTMVDPDALERT